MHMIPIMIPFFQCNVIIGSNILKNLFARSEMGSVNTFFGILQPESNDNTTKILNAHYYLIFSQLSAFLLLSTDHIIPCKHLFVYVLQNICSYLFSRQKCAIFQHASYCIIYKKKRAIHLTTCRGWENSCSMLLKLPEMLIKWHIIFVVDVFLVILCKPEWEAIQDLDGCFHQIFL